MEERAIRSKAENLARPWGHGLGYPWGNGVVIGASACRHRHEVFYSERLKRIIYVGNVFLEVMAEYSWGCALRARQQDGAFPSAMTSCETRGMYEGRGGSPQV
jgi:hypothetical protein